MDLHGGSAHNEFVAGTTYTDTLDGRCGGRHDACSTVNILGTNDAATFSGRRRRKLTETNAALIDRRDAGGQRRRQCGDVVAQTDVAGSNCYGKFTIDANGAWTYTVDSAHNEFVAGTTYTDS